jgi:hypothetical protein
VVHGESLRHPQHVRVVLPVVVERPQGQRPDALDVVEVKVLVADEAQPVSIGLRAVELGRVERDRRRVRMLLPAAAAADVHEDVAPVGELSHEVGGRLDHASEVGDDLQGVDCAELVPDELVRNAPRVERQDPLISDEDRGTVENVEVRSEEGAQLPLESLEAGRDGARAGRGLDRDGHGMSDLPGQTFLAVFSQASARPAPSPARKLTTFFG